MKELLILEEERKKAIENLDYVKIYDVYNQLGIEPESAVQYYYDLGEVENMFNLKSRKLEVLVKQKRKRITPDSTYEEFYQKSSSLSLNIGVNSDKKRELLIKYFPGRFGDEGRIPVYNMNYPSVGRLFVKMMEYTKERIPSVVYFRRPF